MLRVIEECWIPLGEGRRLSARVWLPEVSYKVPAILEYLPYRKRDGTALRDETTHRVFCEAGYGCVRVDIAGTGDSEGGFDDEYSEAELRDGEAVLAWIGEQEWCDGGVGMIGISWGGFNGLQLASRRPPELKAVVSVASSVDRYEDDIHYMGGCLLSDNVNWGGQMLAYLTRPADPLLRSDWKEDWLRRLEGVPFLAADWLRHPYRDEYWKHGSVCEDWSLIEVPVLAMTGWADAYVNAPSALVSSALVSSALATSALATFSKGVSKAMVGPWEHRYAHISKLESSDFHGEVLNWFDRWLKGIENGVEKLPDYRVYMQEHFHPMKYNTKREGRWVAERDWPSPFIEKKTLYLAEEGRLVEGVSRGEVRVSSRFHVGARGGYFCPGMRIDNELAEDQAEDDGLSSCFYTEVLEESLEILGRARLRICFSVDKPVAQLVARLCDVSEEGVSQRITYRALNLTHHASHEKPEILVPGTLVPGTLVPGTLVPGDVYEAEIVLNECAHRVGRGHRLCLALSTSYWPIVWPSPERAEVRLYLESCELELPERRVKEEIAPMNPGPARDFPTLDAEVLREESSKSERRVNEEGCHVLETFDDYGKRRDPYHGMISGSDVSMCYKIHPDDSTRASFESFWNFTFEREGWQVEIASESGMTCDGENFYLHRRVRAREGGEEVFAREWRETVPRGLL